jgi:hypothetical protein
MLAKLLFFILSGVALAETVDGNTSGHVPVAANRNDREHLKRESEWLILQLLADAKDAAVVLKGDDIISFTITSDKLDGTHAAEIAKSLTHFLSLRVEGHSFEYASYVILHGADKWLEEEERQIRQCPTCKEEIAFPWIRSDIHDTIAFPFIFDPGVTEKICVVDGELAWIYFVPKKASPDMVADQLLRFRIDAIEFSPAASELMHSIFDEMKGKGRTPTKTNRVIPEWWFEFQEKLKQKAGVKWMTPIELNPELQF